MPPVFGPWSSSKIALWSWEDGSGSTVRPSVNARTEASSPSRHSSISTRSAGRAELALDHHEVQRRAGLGLRVTDDDSLARGQAVGLDHHRDPGAPQVLRRFGESVKLRPSAVGMP